MATKNQSRAAGPATRGLKVTARPASFRRGGHTFSGEAKTIPLSELSAEQVEQITTDPNLVVQEVDIEPPAETQA
ncbi:MAG: hypothetical protein Q7K57_47360 [Burkholderiaceae bacterium]|nr:hypothetical protein [Burkholderiaceae bacterium]